MYNSRRSKLIDSDRKQTSACLGKRSEKEGDEGSINWHKDTFGGDGHVYYFDCSHGFSGVYICQSFKFYTLSIYS